MAMELRPAGSPKSFDLFDGEEKIGEILYDAPDGPDGPFGWDVDLWSLSGSEKTWGQWGATIEEAVDHAHDLYKELVADRRHTSSPPPGPRRSTISTPMGGQKRR